MATERANDLQPFKRFIDESPPEFPASGASGLSAWRVSLSLARNRACPASMVQHPRPDRGAGPWLEACSPWCVSSPWRSSNDMTQ